MTIVTAVGLVPKECRGLLRGMLLVLAGGCSSGRRQDASGWVGEHDPGQLFHESQYVQSHSVISLFHGCYGSVRDLKVSLVDLESTLGFGLFGCMGLLRRGPCASRNAGPAKSVSV